MKEQSVTLYQKSKTGKIKTWTLEQKKDKLITTWGYKDGALQTTTDIISGKNVGKKNATTNEQQASLEFDRLVKSQKEDGYTESLDKVNAAPQKLIFSNLPTGFCPAKPITSISREKALDLIKAGKAIVTRKVDGYRHYVVKDENGQVKIYSRNMKDLTAHLPNLVQACKKMPICTIIDCELFINDGERDHFRELSEVLRCKPEEAIKRQEKITISAFCFDLLFLSTKEVWKQPYGERLNLLKDLLNNCFGKNSGFLLPANLLAQFKAEDLFDRKIPYSWEGLIIGDLTQSTSIRFDGHHDRKNLYKWKYAVTEDCIARSFDFGNGKHKNRVGYLNLFQYHDGKEIFVGKVGSGMTDQEREDLLNAHYPIVVEIEAAERTEDMKFRFPTYLRIRLDKSPTPEDCSAQLMPRQQ